MTERSVEDKEKFKELAVQVDRMITEYQQRYREEMDSYGTPRNLVLTMMENRGLIPYTSLLVLQAFKVGLLVSTERARPKITLPSGEIIFKLNDNS